MKKVLSLIALFCSSIIVNAQSGALLFDGVDDYAELLIDNSMLPLDNQMQSIRIVFRSDTISSNLTLLSQIYNGANVLTLGLVLMEVYLYQIVFRKY